MIMWLHESRQVKDNSVAPIISILILWWWTKTKLKVYFWQVNVIMETQVFVLVALSLFSEGGDSYMLNAKMHLQILSKSSKNTAVKGQRSCWQAQLATKRALFIDLADRDLHWHFPLLLSERAQTLQLNIFERPNQIALFDSQSFCGPVAYGESYRRRDDREHVKVRHIFTLQSDSLWLK